MANPQFAVGDHIVSTCPVGRWEAVVHEVRDRKDKVLKHKGDDGYCYVTVGCWVKDGSPMKIDRGAARQLWAKHMTKLKKTQMKENQ